jgi:hypothetical protein
MPKIQSLQNNADFLADVQASIEKARRSAERDNKRQHNNGCAEYWRKQRENLRDNVRSWDAITPVSRSMKPREIFEALIIGAILSTPFLIETLKEIYK